MADLLISHGRAAPVEFFLAARDEVVVEPLVIPFAVIMLNGLNHGPPEMLLRSRHSTRRLWLAQNVL